MTLALHFKYKWHRTIYFKYEWHCTITFKYEWHCTIYFKYEWHCTIPFKYEWHCTIYSNMNDTVQYSSNMNDTVHIYLVYQREHTDWFNVMSSNSLIYTLLPLYFVIFQHSELCESKHRLLTNSRSSRWLIHSGSGFPLFV